MNRCSRVYSFRGASIGSTPAAREAGITEANSPATQSSNVASASQTGSVGLTDTRARATPGCPLFRQSGAQVKEQFETVPE